MDPAASAAELVVDTLFGLYTLAILLRFLFQLVKADYYNPISQFIVKATNPLLVPLRRIIPGLGGIDLAALVLAVIIQFINFSILSLIRGLPLDPTFLLIGSAFSVLDWLLRIYFWGLLIVVIVSWIAPGNYNPTLVLLQQVLEPVLSRIRRIMPDTGMIDLSPIVLFLLINIIRIFVDHLKGLAFMPGAF